MTALNRREFLKVSTAAAALPVAGCIARPIPVRSPYASAIPDARCRHWSSTTSTRSSTPRRVRAIVKPRTVADVQAAVAARAVGGRSRWRSPAGGMRWAASSSAKPACWSTHAASTASWRSTPSAASSRSRAASSGRSCSSISIACRRAPARQWGIYQKQTGADRLSIGGALACNAHGRGLNLKPIVQQVEAFDLVGRAAASCAPARAPRTRICSASPSAATACSASSRECTSAAAARQGPARRRCSARRRPSWSVSRSASATAICTATTSSRPTPRATASCGAASSPATSPCPTTRRSPSNPTRFNPEDWARLTFYSHTLQAPRVRGRTRRATWRRPARSTGPTRSSSAAYVDNYHADLDRALHAKVPGDAR